MRRPTLDAARAFALSTPFLAVVIALVTWQSAVTAPSFGIDPGWQVGIEMAAHRGFDWGTQLISPYGPLGYLAVHMAIYGGQAVLGVVYLLATRIGFAAALLWTARRRGFSLPLAIGVALVGSAIATRGDPAVVPIAFLCCAAALALDDPPAWVRPTVIYGGAFLAALELLVKLNYGISIFVMAAVTVVAMPGRRWVALGKLLGTAIVSFLILWLAAGQGFGNLWDYLRTSASVISGYSSALQSSIPAWTAIAGLLVIAAALAFGWAEGRGLDRARRWGLFLLVAAFCFAAWKEGVVRHHLVILFAWLLLPWLGALRDRSARGVALAGFGATALLWFAATGFGVSDVAHPISSPQTAVNQVYELVDPGKRDELRDAARGTDQIAYAVDKRTLELIGHRPVDIYPWEDTLAWAYGLNWDPQPVFRSFGAYTSLLDHRNADVLASPSGPQLILRHRPEPLSSNPSRGLDDRYIPWDAPAATREMLCGYRAIRTTDRYQLLERDGDRCGTPRPLGTVTTSYGEAVRVPRSPGPDDAVFAKVSGLAPSGTERVQSLLYRAGLRYVTFDGDRTYRIGGANAVDGVIFSAPPRLDFPPPWQLAPNAETVSFRRSASVAWPSSSIKLSFYAVPLRSP